jgi:ABC-type multidrug transport system permease subunit
MLPKVLQGFAHFLPQYHLAHLGLAVIGAVPPTEVRLNLLALLAFGVVFTALAAWAYNKDDGAAYG